MPSPGTSNIRARWNALWHDPRSWRSRLVPAALCSFALCFTVLFFGPVELTAYNVEDLRFGVPEIWPTMAIASLASAAGLALLLSVLRGRLHDYAMCACFALTVGCYIQGNYLNGDLGILTGDRIRWEDYTRQSSVNFLFWLVLVVLAFAARYFVQQHWRRIVCYVCALLVLMQTAGLASIGFAGLLTPDEIPSRAYLSDENLYNYSSEKNVLVILVDRLDYGYLEQALQQEPQFLDFLDGFTSYSNAISPFLRTLPGANATLTGYHTDVYQIPLIDYFDASWDWDGRHLLTDLADAGYTIDIYTEQDCLFGREDVPKAYVRNFITSRTALDRFGLIRGLLRVSAYRYAPEFFKPAFWTYTDAVRRKTAPQEGRYEVDDIIFSNGLYQTQLTQTQNSFRFIHLNGSHAPYTIGADGLLSATETTAVDQTIGCFKILRELFGRMKELGIYEDAAIIITADHGYAIDDGANIDQPVLIGLLYKPSGSTDTPLASSAAPVSTTNIAATVLKNAGVDYSAYGPALDEVQETDTPLRFFFKTLRWDYAERDLYVYQVGRNASDFSEWEVIDHLPVGSSFY